MPFKSPLKRESQRLKWSWIESGIIQAEKSEESGWYGFKLKNPGWNRAYHSKNQNMKERLCWKPLLRNLSNIKRRPMDDMIMITVEESFRNWVMLFIPSRIPMEALSKLLNWSVLENRLILKKGHWANTITPTIKIAASNEIYPNNIWRLDRKSVV